MKKINIFLFLLLSSSLLLVFQNCADDLDLSVYDNTSNQTPNPLPPAVAKSCKELYERGERSDGVYSLDIDGDDFTPVADAYCDMQTDGGGWMLILNYNHLANSNPNLAPSIDSLPLLGGDVFADESANLSYWKHASPALISRFDFSDVRFYCRSSGHPRIIHFKTNEPNCLSYLKTGLGSCDATKTVFMALPNHTGNLPAILDLDRVESRDKLNLSLTDHTFYNANQSYWNIKGLANRWECDEFNQRNPDGTSTIHRVWVR